MNDDALPHHDIFRLREVMKRIRERGPMLWRDAWQHVVSGYDLRGVEKYIVRRRQEQDLLILSREGRVVITRSERGAIVAVSPAELGRPKAAVLLPMLERADGDRRNDCTRFGGVGGCLDRFCRANPRAQVARCPEACAHYEVRRCG